MHKRARGPLTQAAQEDTVTLIGPPSLAKETLAHYI